MQVSYLGYKLKATTKAVPVRPTTIISKKHNTNNHSDILMVVPCTKGLSESFKNICRKMGVHFKGGNTIKNFLVASKDKDNITQEWSNI